MTAAEAGGGSGMVPDAAYDEIAAVLVDEAARLDREDDADQEQVAVS